MFVKLKGTPKRKGLYQNDPIMLKMRAEAVLLKKNQNLSLNIDKAGSMQLENKLHKKRL